MEDSRGVNKSNKNYFCLGILIGVLITAVVGLSVFIIYDKVLKEDNIYEQGEQNNNSEKVEDEDSSNDKLNENVNSNDNNDNSNNPESTILEFDVSKFDTAKEAINVNNGRGYELHTEDFSDMGISIRLNENKKSATIVIDWSKYGKFYGTSTWTGETREYEITNFTKNIKEVFISGFGQGVGYETAFYVMEDGTVEYTPLKHSLGNKGSSSETVLKSYGPIENVSGVAKVLSGIDYCLNNVPCLGSGLHILGVKPDGSFYNLSYILYQTDYYHFY